MKYKVSALILGLTFAGLSQAAPVTINYTLTAPIFGPPSGIFNGGAATEDSVVNTSTTSSVTLPSSNSNLTQVLDTVTFTARQSAALSSTTVTDQYTLTVANFTPTASSFIIANFLDTITNPAGTTHNHSFSSPGASSLTFVGTSGGFNGQVLTVTLVPASFAVAGNPLVTNGATATATGLGSVSANFNLTAPEPGTFGLLAGSLIGLGFVVRRRKTAA